MPMHRSSTTTAMGIDATPQLSVNPPAGSTTVPRHRFPNASMDPTTAYQIVHDHLGQAAPARGAEASGFDHATAQRKS
jgi:hypothetical protein